ncbi:hypothetical protein EUX98_g2424 [Antrodiella citrinella]|uniref:RNA 3'-terminal phosphate cyclase n=1 Tax=Antrodiella citrinella TaxID=2447956 RepID=A0A4S4N194_9APHY|nr:hypothetical protein EUX98_g2424 [Antrodiella citrinella]
MSETDISPVVLDGGILEGGGQIVRLAISLAILLRKPVSITNIRKNRRDPGLKAQHVAGLRLASEICSGSLTGCELGSTAIEFRPGLVDPFQKYLADPKTAGSITLLLQIALPCLLFSKGHTHEPGDSESVVDLTLRGGTNATYAPQIDWTEHVFFPFLQRHLRLEPRFAIRKRGYFPKGGGEVHFTISPVVGPLPAFTLISRGNIISIKGKAWVAGLPRSVALEMRDAAVSALVSSDLCVSSDIIDIEADRESPRLAVGSGSGIILWAETEKGCRFGGSCLGRKGTVSSAVGEEAAQELIRNLAHGGCVDEYLQDQIIVFMTLAAGRSTVRMGRLTPHTKTAIYVAEKLTDARFSVVEDTPEGPTTITCEGIVFRCPEV